jgi:class 3 adenylate cyclase
MSQTLGMGRCVDCGKPLPPNARFCPGCGTPVADQAAPREERKVATIVFADLTGSTALAHSEDPERTRAFLARFYAAMGEEIAQRGGTLDKFMGDAALAVFGAPLALEDHAQRALQTAFAMRARLDEIDDRLRLRVGINTGEVVAGDPHRSDSFITGDVVNVAARLEQAAAPGEILVGERTVAASGEGFTFSAPRLIEAKGKPEGVACRLLLSRRAEPGPRRDAPSLGRALGREREILELEQALERTIADERPRLIRILGDPGIGKTTLVGELRDRVEKREDSLSVYFGRCRRTDRGATYEVLGDIARQRLGVSSHHSTEAIEARLEGRWALGLPLGLDPPGGVHPLAVQVAFRNSWRDLFQEMAEERPTLVVLEDIHWAERLVIEILEDAVGTVRGPLLLVATARPERLNKSGSHAPDPALGVEDLRLSGLSPTHAASLIRRLIVQELPAETESEILIRAEGNPLFVTELTRSALDRHDSSGRSGTHFAGSGPEEYVPDTIQAVLAARIDLLSEDDKATLQAASVIGRTIREGPLVELLDGASPDLRRLEARGFVVRQESSTASGDAKYEIGHALIREVAYASLPRTRRAQLHAKVASWIEGTGAIPSESAAQLAYHYYEAVRPEIADLAWQDQTARLADLSERASLWLRTAASQAIGRFEIDAALSLLFDALSIERDASTRVAILRDTARAHALRFDGREFRSAMEQAIESTETDLESAELYATLAFQALVRAGMWNTSPGGGLVEEWIEKGLSVDGLGEDVRARALIARGYADETKSLETITEAVEIAERTGSIALRSYSYDLRGSRELAFGRATEAHGWHKRRLALLEDITDPDHRADIYFSAIAPALSAGEIGKAREYADRHDEITRSLSAHHRMHGIAAFLEIEYMLGNWMGLRQLQDRVETVVAENVDTPCSLTPRSLLALAVAQAQAGYDDEARRLTAMAGEYDKEGYGTVIDTPRIQLALIRGDLERVESLLGRPAIRRANWVYLASMATHLDALAALGLRERLEAEAFPFLGSGGYLEPFALRALGVVRRDESRLSEAEARFRELGLAHHAEETQGLQAGSP